MRPSEPISPAASGGGWLVFAVFVATVIMLILLIAVGRKGPSMDLVRQCSGGSEVYRDRTTHRLYLRGDSSSDRSHPIAADISADQFCGSRP